MLDLPNFSALPTTRLLHRRAGRRFESWRPAARNESRPREPLYMSRAKSTLVSFLPVDNLLHTFLFIPYHYSVCLVGLHTILPPLYQMSMAKWSMPLVYLASLREGVTMMIPNGLVGRHTLPHPPTHTLGPNFLRDLRQFAGAFC